MTIKATTVMLTDRATYPAWFVQLRYQAKDVCKVWKYVNPDETAFPEPEEPKRRRPRASGPP